MIFLVPRYCYGSHCIINYFEFCYLRWRSVLVAKDLLYELVSHSQICISSEWAVIKVLSLTSFPKVLCSLPRLQICDVSYLHFMHLCGMLSRCFVDAYRVIVDAVDASGRSSWDA